MDISKKLSEQQQSVSDLIHELYNCLAQGDDPKTKDIRESLMRAYQHIGQRDPVVVANKLANYLHFTGYNEKIKFTESELELITQISQIGQHSGLNGSYRAWYGDKSQF
jgi:hypothetical protein